MEEFVTVKDLVADPELVASVAKLNEAGTNVSAELPRGPLTTTGTVTVVVGVVSLEPVTAFKSSVVAKLHACKKHAATTTEHAATHELNVSCLTKST
ncbi:MAG: hypothetical protein HYW49_02330 [Deltaproteobacteria bacterium]|nr:hypothetical protein [Deltaproteobacteria bacterium]